MNRVHPEASGEAKGRKEYPRHSLSFSQAAMPTYGSYRACVSWVFSSNLGRRRRGRKKKVGGRLGLVAVLLVSAEKGENGFPPFPPWCLAVPACQGEQGGGKNHSPFPSCPGGAWWWMVSDPSSSSSSSSPYPSWE